MLSHSVTFNGPSMTLQLDCYSSQINWCENSVTIYQWILEVIIKKCSWLVWFSSKYDNYLNSHGGDACLVYPMCQTWIVRVPIQPELDIHMHSKNAC